MKKFTIAPMNQLYRSVHCFILLIVISFSGYAQNVAINTTLNPANTQAGLDIDFSTNGFLITRLALTSLGSFAPLSAHVAGMITYNTATTADVSPGFYYDDGAKWNRFTPPPGNAIGDIMYWNGTGWAMLPAGLPGQRLQLTSGGLPAWSNGIIATLTTTAVSTITATSANSGGNISSDGGSPVTARGVCWSTSTGPTVALATKTLNGTGLGSFISNLTGLTTATTYYVRAYATNSNGTAYGNELSFITP